MTQAGCIHRFAEIVRQSPDRIAVVEDDSAVTYARLALLELYPEADLPRNAYFADGSPIPVADLDTIREVYDEVSYAFPWQAGDIMVINTMLPAHGREPFTGRRRILAAMTG
jgi:TfdA family taurine catabolism dioxygenase TauD